MVTVSRTRALAAVAIPAAAIAFAQGAATGLAAVPKAGCLTTAQSTADLDNCVGAQYATARKRLDAAYSKLLAGKGLAQGDRAQLVRAEQAWVRFRGADCEYAASLNKGGTLSGVMKGLCLVRDTTDRAAVLEGYLKTS